LADRFASDLIGISAAILPPYPAESGYFVTGQVERERAIVIQIKVPAVRGS